MLSVIRRLVLLLFTLLHLKPTSVALAHGGGYVYQTPIGVTTPTTFLEVGTRGPGYGLKFNEFSKYALPLVDNYLPDELYVADGRLLKQYEVMESIPGDELPDNFLQMSPLILESFLAKYGRISPSLVPGHGQRAPPPIIPPVTATNEAVSLGSGALGYIKLANGGIYLGSGSLGYISGHERIRDIIQTRAQQNSPPGPFSFGPSPPTYK